MLSGVKPIEKRGTLYVRPGDPIGYRHLCPEGIKRLFGVELKPLETIRVEVTGKVK